MTNAELKIIMRLKDEVTKKVTSIQGRMRQAGEAIKKNWVPITAAVLGTVYALKKLTTAFVNANKELIKVSAKFEKWQIQMEAFTETTALAKEKLQELIDFSVRTPFTPEEVLDVSALLLPLEQAGYKLKDLLTMAGNIAATYPMTFREAALNLNKSLSAGMGAARLFYEQGVRSHMQTISGIKDLTKVSQAELAKIFYDIYVDPSSPLARGMEKLSLTYEGLMSTIQGEWMLFKKAVSEEMFEEVKLDLQGVLLLIRESKEEGGEYKEVVKDVSMFFKEAYENAKEFGVTVLITGAQAVDFFNELKWTVKGFTNFLRIANVGVLELLDTMTLGLTGLSDVKDQAQEMLVKALEEEMNLEKKASIDYSTILQQRIEALRQALKTKKEEITKNEKDITKTVNEENNKRLKVAADKANAEIKMWTESNKTYIEATLSMGKTTATIMGELATMTGETWLKGAEIVVNTIVSVMKVIIAAVNSTLGPLGWLKAALEITAITLAAANAFAQLEAQKRALEQVKKVSATPTVSVPAMAGGGDVIYPGMALVGERGPELAYLPRGARVSPLTEGPGGSTYYITVNLTGSYIGSEEIADEIAPAIKERLDDLEWAERRRA